MATQVCSRCSCTNPPDASYCYYDGARLAGADTGGPINAATQNFPMPFTFPSGLVCRNFDQFATACQENWDAAKSMLKEGMLANFLGGMGRADLAAAAKEAAKFPDEDRGLDQLLDKLPTQALAPPKLKAEPSDVNLGELPIGKEQSFELHLSNLGTRLVYGTIASDCKWLKIGEAGSSQKLFQFGAESAITVHVLGNQVRAGTKPIEGQLLIESNGGQAAVSVRAMVPITPLKAGLLAGCMTPRQVAEKARANPAGAAPFFEDGTVADWFKSNGWTYPVQGPSVKGLGAVQQFFEALGLAKGPKVQISTQSITLKGAAGQSLTTTIEVSTQEKKLVYAHATCEQPWVDVSKVKLAGRLATITVAIPSVPARPGETLQTKIIVAGNGNQRFTVPLSLAVSGKPASSNPFAELGGNGNGSSTAAPPPVPSRSTATVPSPAPAPAPSKSDNPFADMVAAGPAPPSSSPSSSGIRAKTPMPRTSAEPEPEAEPMIVAHRHRKRGGGWVHAVPLILLLAASAALPIRDAVLSPAGSTKPGGVVNTDAPVDPNVDPKPYMGLVFDYKSAKPEATEPGLYEENMNFGARVLVPVFDRGEKKDAKKIVGYDFVPILYGPRGETNNTLIKVGDAQATFGKPGMGTWVEKPKFTHWDWDPPLPSFVYKQGICTWNFKHIHVTQVVSVVPGELIEVKPGEYKRLQNICEVKYKLENKDTKPRDVAMRVLLDTYIVGNDGAPFTVPGVKGLVTMKEFKTEKEIPDFVTALQNEDLTDPGIVVQLNFRNPGLEPPSRALLTRWPAAGKQNKTQRVAALESWDIPLVNIGDDSSVVMYWSGKPLEPGKPRILGYSYGMGAAAVRKSGNLSVQIGGNLVKDNVFSVLAMVANPAAKETVTIELPPELKLEDGNATQPVPPPQGNRPTQISWRVRSTALGTFPVTVSTHSGHKLRVMVQIIPAPPIF